MISKQDCMLLLADINSKGVDTSSILKTLIAGEPTVEVLSFINQHRPLELAAFYDKVRRSYNQKRSKLYINIVKEVEDPFKLLTTLSALQTQLLLFAETCDDRQLFLRHARASEISLVLNNYFKTYDITPCLKLIRLIKADLKVCEYVEGRDEVN